MSSHYDVNGRATPGQRADGTNKFLMSYEHSRFDESIPNPGRLNIYIYYPEQRENYGDHLFPTGIISPMEALPHNFGPQFKARPDIIPELGRWYCYELMVKVNTVGKRVGRIACWLDGKLIADFTNMWLRDVDSLKIDHFYVDFHIKSNTQSVVRKWCDNIVVARSYIGPVVD
jgi:hypothetical protein